MEKIGKELIVSLDVGSSKVVAMVAEINENGEIEIFGFARQDSKGMREGKVNDLEAIIGVINLCVERVEKQADCQIKSVWTSISGAHIELQTASAMVTVKDNEVSQNDINRVVEMSKMVTMPANKEILHTLTQEFIIDRQGGFRSPLGMSGQLLEARVHFILGGVNETQNLLRCIRRCGLEERGLYYQPIASAEAVLSIDEMDLGTMLIDIGGGTTDYIIYKNQSVITTGVIPFAGIIITNDIAVGLGTTLVEAEDIKRGYGCALAEIADEEVTFDVSCHGEKKNRVENIKTLAGFIEPRVREIFEMVKANIIKSGSDIHITGIVITGGTSLLYGIEDLAENVFGRKARVGVPLVSGKLQSLVQYPYFSTAVGLIKIAQKENRGLLVSEVENEGLSGFFRSVREFFIRNF